MRFDWLREPGPLLRSRLCSWPSTGLTGITPQSDWGGRYVIARSTARAHAVARDAAGAWEALRYASADA